MGIDITHRLLAHDAQSNKSIIAEFDNRWKYSIAGERVDLVFKNFASLVLPNHDSIEEYASDIEKHYLSGSEFPSRSKYSIVREGMEQSELYVHSIEEAQGCMPACIDNVSQRYYTRPSRVGMEFGITKPSFKMVLKDEEQRQQSHLIEFSGFELDEMPNIVKALVKAYAKYSKAGIVKVIGEQNRYFDMQANEVSFADLTDEQREYLK